jgi:hypothetical protein
VIIPRSIGIPRPSERPRIRAKLLFAEKQKKNVIN